ncbi:MAG: hypothetical protein A2W99_01930 [Bacteroidetes bacterium GWF2_33_16]|nr:MAG: hypothetical protein A2X00_16225 [Bacteroidetes bacterium GWE2_32_14]OFY07028.1 MAG: hypothetical protein A2W99_01930 [Bacteroidetes bacterium GWF2_33_16]
MKKVVVLFFVLFLIISCRNDEIIKDLFQEPPVSPIAQTIKTCIPVGYAATAMVAYFQGNKFKNVRVEENKNATVLYIDTSVDYPYKFKDDTYGEMIVAGIQLSENTAILSVFFTETSIRTGRFRLKDVKTFPVIYNNESIKVVYAGYDINFGGDIDLIMNLTQDEIDIELEKLGLEIPYSEYLAIDQNAWIIDIYHNNTFDDFTDDVFEINGGQQSIEVSDYELGSSVSAMQIAMINTEYSLNCLKNPTQGYAFMQDVELESKSKGNTVFGSVFYTFHSRCDGDVEVTVATGNFITSIGKEINLELL